MANLKKYDLMHDKAKDDWALKDRESGRTVRRFDTKTEGTQGGILSGAIGQKGGSVVIRKIDGTIQEERTFPGSADPRSSKG